MYFNSSHCIRWSFLLIFVSVFLNDSVDGWALKKYFFDEWARYSNQELKDLRDLSRSDLKRFFQSFDTVITDIDETLMKNRKAIPGAIENIKKLQEWGKKILFLTNNSAYPKAYFIDILRAIGLYASPENIIIPSDTLNWYLRNRNSVSRAFVIGTTNFVDSLYREGISVTTGPTYLAENFERTVPQLLDLDPNVNMVIFEFDINLNYGKMMVAAGYLKRNDVLFLMGAPESKIPVIENLALIGAAPFVDLLAKHTGRTPVSFSKPSNILKDYLMMNSFTNDFSRTLFIGDTLSTDMKFAELCGAQRLWVKSGVDGSNSCEDGCEGSPTYFLPDLGKMPIDCCS